MNEQIRQLVLQAKIGTADFDAGSYYVATPDRMQKFAELIVRECARRVDYWESRQGEHTEDLLKHFGVE
jgi:hypothetical protein